jgi:hypothetical protein
MSLHQRQDANGFSASDLKSSERSRHDPVRSSVPSDLQIRPEAAKMTRDGSEALYKNGTYFLHKDLIVRTLGGYSLLVLAR